MARAARRAAAAIASADDLLIAAGAAIGRPVSQRFHQGLAARTRSMREPSRRLSSIVLVLATIVCFGIVCTYGFTNTEDEGLISRNPMFNPPTAASLRQI
jgi:TRAP-type C4-dicarboxylate transport system permease small subunit